MTQNVLKTVSEKLIASMERIEKCSDTDVEMELKRGAGLTLHAEQIVATAKIHAAVYIQTGTLPADNLIFAHGEQMVTGGFLGEKKRERKGLMMNDFNKV